MDLTTVANVEVESCPRNPWSSTCRKYSSVGSASGRLVPTGPWKPNSWTCSPRRSHSITNYPRNWKLSYLRLEGLDDQALREVSQSRLSENAARNMGDLHRKRQADGLTSEESVVLAELVREYERIMMIRARAVELLGRRGIRVWPHSNSS